MPLFELEFELSAEQHRLMEYPELRQGQPLTLVLDGGILLPDPGASAWYAVQKEALDPGLHRVGPGLYAFAGQISEAEIEYGREQLAYLGVHCGPTHLRITCAPQEDGQLPDGTWETRYISGLANVQGLVEDPFNLGIGQAVDVTLWQFRRLVLSPGDPNFGQWYETPELPPVPFRHDKIFVTARVHRRGV